MSNYFSQFFPNGCYDALLLYWYNIIERVIMKRERFSTFDISSIEEEYHSYLPQEKFQYYLKTGFDMIKEGLSSPEYVKAVFAVFYAEVLRDYNDKLCIGELIVLRNLLIALIHLDLDAYLYTALDFSSSEANQIISTRIMNYKKNSQISKHNNI